MIKKKYIINLLCLFFIGLFFYGFSRLYYFSTDGFAIKHITFNLPYNPSWQTASLNENENKLIYQILDQEFRYLGKGCQSYVFESKDNKYVLKFFKYQRMREKNWLEPFYFIPYVKNYCEKKNIKKQKKREGVFRSWKLAYENLSHETGIIYVHLNQSNLFNKIVTIVDKVGYRHHIKIDDYQFMIQKKAKMLCEEIENYMVHFNEEKAINLLKKLTHQILDEYHRGFADNDHALIQNTGVVEEEPVHIDIGQFVYNEEIKNESFHLQELFTKTYKFRIWLKEKYPALNEKFENYLRTIIPDFDQMKPLWRDRIEIFQS